MAEGLPTKSHLERLITSHAQANDSAHTRIRRWVSTMVLVGALARVRDDDDLHRFVIKGGVAMELRLGSGARATADVDATFYGDVAALEEALEEAFANPLSGFTFRITAQRAVAGDKARRSSVRLDYQGKPWATVDLEVSASQPPADIELVPAFGLEDFGLTGPTHIATLSARYQLAQKVHAVTERFEDGPNNRVRDVIDILLLRSVLPAPSLTREACVEVFAARATHLWPPTIEIYEGWELEYSRLRDAIGFDIELLSDAVDEVHELINSIDRAGGRPG